MISQGAANEDLAKTPSVELMPSGDPGRNVHTNFKSYAINTTVSKKSRVSALAGLESSAIRSQLSNAFSNQSPVR